MICKASFNDESKINPDVIEPYLCHYQDAYSCRRFFNAKLKATNGALNKDATTARINTQEVIKIEKPTVKSRPRGSALKWYAWQDSNLLPSA
jgi:hypothetical protein